MLDRGNIWSFPPPPKKKSFTPRPMTKEVDRTLAAPEPNWISHYDIVHVYDSTAVNLYRWTYPEKGSIWWLCNK